MPPRDHLTPEARERIAAANRRRRGERKTMQHRAKIAASVRRAWERDPRPWRMTDQQREKIARGNKLHQKIARLARLILAEVED